MKYVRKSCAVELVAGAWIAAAWVGAVEARDPEGRETSPITGRSLVSTLVRLGEVPGLAAVEAVEVEETAHPRRPGPSSTEEALKLDSEALSETPSTLLGPLVGSRATVTAPFGFSSAQATHQTVDTPDPQIAVGPAVSGTSGFIVTAYHRGLSYHLKNNTPMGGLTFANLFSPTPAAELFDPRLVFDPYMQRFVLLVLRTQWSTSYPSVPILSKVYLAVSSGPDPRQPWSRVVLDMPYANLHPDFPSLGYDRQNLYLGINLLYYQGSGGGAGFSIANTWFVAVDKAQLTGSGTALSTSVLQLAGDFEPWAPRAVEQLDLPANSPPVGLFVASIKGQPGPPPETFNRLRVYKLRNAFTPQESFSGANVTVPAYDPPHVDAPQHCPGTSGAALDVLSGQLLNAVWRAGDLYTAHTIWDPADSWGTPNQVRWYQLRSGPPQAPVWWTQLVQTSDLDNEVLWGNHTLSPVIGVDANLSVALVFTQTSAASFQYPRLRAISRAACEPVGLFGPAITLKSSSACNTHCTNPADCPPQRWGDYLGMAVDPADPAKLWAVGEYLPNSTSWQLWVSELAVTPNCGTCTCQP